MVEKHRIIGIYNPIEMNLLLQVDGVIARLCIVAVRGEIWKHTGPIMLSLNNFKVV